VNEGKKRRVWLNKKFYFYKELGQYLRQKLGTKEGCVDYRFKEVKPGRLVLLCIRRKEGPRGGKTRAIALLRSFRVRKPKDKKVLKLLKKAKELAKELRDDGD